MGVVGAAIATILSRFLIAAVGIALFIRGSAA